MVVVVRLVASFHRLCLCGTWMICGVDRDIQSVLVGMNVVMMTMLCYQSNEGNYHLVCCLVEM